MDPPYFCVVLPPPASTTAGRSARAHGWAAPLSIHSSTQSESVPQSLPINRFRIVRIIDTAMCQQKRCSPASSTTTAAASFHGRWANAKHLIWQLRHVFQEEEEEEAEEGKKRVICGTIIRQLARLAASLWPRATHTSTEDVVPALSRARPLAPSAADGGNNMSAASPAAPGRVSS